MSSRNLPNFSWVRDNKQLVKHEDPTWAFVPSTPQASGIGHNGGPTIYGVPVNNIGAPNAGPRDFAPAKSDCSKSDIGAAPRPDLN